MLPLQLIIWIQLLKIVLMILEFEGCVYKNKVKSLMSFWVLRYPIKSNSLILYSNLKTNILWFYSSKTSSIWWSWKLKLLFSVLKYSQVNYLINLLDFDWDKLLYSYFDWAWSLAFDYFLKFRKNVSAAANSWVNYELNF